MRSYAPLLRPRIALALAVKESDERDDIDRRCKAGREPITRTSLRDSLA